MRLGLRLRRGRLLCYDLLFFLIAGERHQFLGLHGLLLGSRLRRRFRLCLGNELFLVRVFVVVQEGRELLVLLLGLGARARGAVVVIVVVRAAAERVVRLGLCLGLRAALADLGERGLGLLLLGGLRQLVNEGTSLLVAIVFEHFVDIRSLGGFVLAGAEVVLAKERLGRHSAVEHLSEVALERGVSRGCRSSRAL